MQAPPNYHVSPNGLLPLFHEEAKSVAMMKHGMNIIKQATDKLNPGQIPIVAADQPLYTLAKQIQWHWPDTHGEDKFIVMFGGLHIEMAILKVLGEWLTESGWTTALSPAKITTPGTADSFLKASHVKHTRHAHQVTAASLYILLKESYEIYKQGCQGNPMTEEEWIQNRAATNPQFKYWHTTLDLELLMLTYIHSVREGNFQLYIEVITKFMPWFFALDHTNYARWLSVHVRDMTTLHDRHPAMAEEFDSGNFVVHKSRRAFSAIASDQAHEQNNGKVKGEGGAVGLTESPNALRRWMVAGPEIARVIEEFEATIDGRKITHADEDDVRHLEQFPGVQKRFKAEVKDLASTLEDMGNPFTEESNELMALHTKDIVDKEVVDTVKNIVKIGQQQFDTFVTDRLEKRTTTIYDPIKRNKLPLFSRPPVKEKSKLQNKVMALKHDRTLFSRLYIACQTRDGNLADFFKHENQASPPSLSENGKLYQGVKSDIIQCLEPLSSHPADTAPVVDATMLDGPAVVHMLPPDEGNTFEEYANTQFQPHIQSQHCARVDIIWDEYLENSLKATTRSKRGKGLRRKVTPTSIVPSKKSWPQFLRIDDNKRELFAYLSEKVVTMQTEKEICATSGNNVLLNHDKDTTTLMPCSHEEADTRIFLHALDASQSGYKRILIRTVDSDVLVLAVASFYRLDVTELWLAFGTGKNLKYLAVHEIATSLGQIKSRALPMFHAFTGCDTVSSFQGRRKKTAWETWKVCDAVTECFIELSQAPQAITEENMGLLEHFTVLLYDRTSPHTDLNLARMHLFTQKGRAIENIPPSKGALVQHAHRAVFQGGHCWGQCLLPSPVLPSPGDWGWKLDANGIWTPLWSTLPEAMKSMWELISCGCKKGCTGRCKCVNASLQCTALCACGGECARE
jgi:hypothetical protein